jgi:membrane-associated phospholipid phosphatase
VAFIEASRNLGHFFVRGHDRTRVRLVFVVAVFAPLAAFFPFAVKAWRQDTFAWDAEVSERVHAYGNRQTGLNTYMDVLGLVLHPAIQVVGALLVLAGVLALVGRGHVRAALFLGLTTGGAVIGAPLLKELFGSPPINPHEAGYSFPSGHALRSMTAVAALTTVAWPTGWRRKTAVLGGITVMAIGLALVYHEWHWASDVIAGWCLGVAWVACVWLVLQPLYPARAGRSRSTAARPLR